MHKTDRSVQIAVVISGKDVAPSFQFELACDSAPPTPHLNRLVLSGGTIDLRELPHEDCSSEVSLNFVLSGTITIDGRAHDVDFARDDPFLYRKQTHDLRPEPVEFLVRDPKRTAIEYTFDGDGLVHEYELKFTAPGTRWAFTLDPAIINRLGGGGG
jgi:hypothetical protein